MLKVKFIISKICFLNKTHTHTKKKKKFRVQISLIPGIYILASLAYADTKQKLTLAFDERMQSVTLNDIQFRERLGRSATSYAGFYGVNSAVYKALIFGVEFCVKVHFLFCFLFYFPYFHFF